MKVYFSHPTFTYRTKTEERCIEIIKKAFGKDYKAVKVINPSTFGFSINPVKKIKKADKIVGMAVSDELLYLVWKELELAEKFDVDQYIFYVESKDSLGPLVEGVPDSLTKLSKEESKVVSHRALKDQKESFISMIVGNWGGRF